MAQIFRNEKHSEQQLILESDSTKAILCDSGSEDTLAVGSNSNKSGSQGKVWSRQHTWNSGGVHPFTGGPQWSGVRIQGTAIFFLFFMDVIHLFVADTNKYYN
jgi:hypothetical protein